MLAMTDFGAVPSSQNLSNLGKCIIIFKENIFISGCVLPRKLVIFFSFFFRETLKYPTFQNVCRGLLASTKCQMKAYQIY